MNPRAPHLWTLMLQALRQTARPYELSLVGGRTRPFHSDEVEDLLGSSSGVPVKGPAGEARTSYTSGSVQVIAEGDIVITIITR